MKQPALGSVSSVLVIVVSLGFIALFALPVFTTWIADAMVCIIPMVVVIGVTWGGKHPAIAARRSQPAKGTLFLLLALTTGAVVALVHFVVVGGRIGPPAPMLSMCIITTVPFAFWFAIIWGGWPFTALIRNRVAAGFSMWAASYVVNYLLFRLFFNYGFMQDTPQYKPALDPHGLFNAWNVLVFYITVTSVMFLMLSFELWPLAKRPALMRQPLLGAIWTALVLAIGAAALFIGEGLFRMDPAVFMVRVPIPFIFGTIIVMNMMQNSLFARFTQPLKGLLNAAAGAVIGVGLARLFGALAPAISGRVESGAPAYIFEIWLASALLAVTFPFLIIFADLFQFWPLRATKE
ncbi:MAG TPA: hypothetical protein VFB30_13970 [Spirochaetia bacterium]|nr:hypothetical protein [Spirochaetia bacterium]